MKRRVLLTSLGTVAVSSLAGCSGRFDGDAPAGSLRFENRDGLPHVIGLSVVSVGAESETDQDGYGVSGDVTVPPRQRTLTASSSVSPDETQTFERVFTEAVYYLVEFTVDGTPPETGGRVPFNPSPPGRENDRVLKGVVYSSGEFSWVVSSTENAGGFD